MSANSPNPILVRMMESGEFSDLKFLCNGQEFKVHKAVVCVQSPMIKAATQGRFEESDTNVITMDNFQPETVRQLVQFMYTGDYNDHKDEREAPDQNNCAGNSDEIEEETASFVGHQIQFGDIEVNIRNLLSKGPPAPSPPESTATASLFEHLRVNSIGDYYRIDKLVSLANNKIKHLLRSDSEDQSWVASLPGAIEAAVQSTGDDELLGIFASAAAANISTLLESDQFASLGVVTDFSIKVLQRCAEESQALTWEREANKLQLQEAEEQLRESKLEISQLRGCLEALNRTSHCRNCSAEFQCTIYPNECLLRCAKCRCKHYG